MRENQRDKKKLELYEVERVDNPCYVTFSSKP